MGQEASTHVDESVPPQTLHDRSVDAVAKLITEERARKIVVMVSLALIEKQGAEEERQPVHCVLTTIDRCRH